ncbi:hypothetical protein A3709_20155 [Halioglobus sp. HI00S01]|uniref:hypothetical protein n=1 Tax=Halioglobus sp. HI00S01 TaxID=1822214 RepID=UPI0007C260BF|nr:hypothetical protein [Halioglobus sp. HI00S01]KZX57940.1 hypothetical protein A3709_20155 [Halioglobus sp. HI00S01]
MSEAHTDTKKQDSKKQQWMTKAHSAFAGAMGSKSITSFDKLLLQGQLNRLRDGLSVSFSDRDDVKLKTIRAQRLKILGYTYDVENKCWSKAANT